MNDAVILQMFAIAYLAVGIGGLVDPDMAKSLVRDFENNRALTYVSGIVATIIGYAIASTRPGMDTVASQLVSLIGAVAIIKGFSLIAFPKWSLRISGYVANSNVFTHTYPYLALILSGAAFWFSQP